MRSRRWLLIFLVLGLGAVGIHPVPAAQYFGLHLQRVPFVEWGTPVTGPFEGFDGIGQWVYVAPIPPAGPGQVPTTGYVYGPGFGPGGSAGVIGLSTDGQGGIAGLAVGTSGTNSAPVVIRYDWSPGSFYFLLTYHLGNGLWGGWVYDNAASTWTFIGTAQAPDTGLLTNRSHSQVGGAHGEPLPAFSRDGQGAIAGPCRSFARVDAYFYPPLSYHGTDATQATQVDVGQSIGDCPTAATVEAGWVHMRLGTLPAGS